MRRFFTHVLDFMRDLMMLLIPSNLFDTMRDLMMLLTPLCFVDQERSRSIATLQIFTTLAHIYIYIYINIYISNKSDKPYVQDE